MLFPGRAGASTPPPIGRRPRKGSGFSTYRYTLYVRDKALAKQHYAQQARNTKLIDPETGIRLRAGTSRSELLREMAERGERQSGGGCQKLADARVSPLGRPPLSPVPPPRAPHGSPAKSLPMSSPAAPPRLVVWAFPRRCRVYPLVDHQIVQRIRSRRRTVAKQLKQVGPLTIEATRVRGMAWKPLAALIARRIDDFTRQGHVCSRTLFALVAQARLPGSSSICTASSTTAPRPTNARVTGTPFRRSVMVRRPSASAWVTNRRPHDPSGGGRPGLQKTCALPPVSRGVKVLPHHYPRARCRFFRRRLEHARQRYTSMCEHAASRCADNAERHQAPRARQPSRRQRSFSPRSSSSVLDAPRDSPTALFGRAYLADACSRLLFPC